MARPTPRRSRLKVTITMDDALYELLWKEHHETDIAISRIIEQQIRKRYGVPKAAPARRNGGKAG